MGTLVPADLRLDGLDAGERQVVERFRDRLPDSWLIVPRVDVHDVRRPFEVDILLVHADSGLLAVEVKGGPVACDRGVWSRRKVSIEPSPPRQAQNAAFALRDHLRHAIPELSRLGVAHAVALPDVAEMTGSLGPGVTREQLLLGPELDDPRPAVIGAAAQRQTSTLSDTQINQIMGVLRPDAGFRWDREAFARAARASLNRLTEEQTRALASLDLNRRAVVTGAAGTGKTRMAIEWARRARARGERVLLTCYNTPLATYLREANGDAPDLHVAAILELARALPGVPPLVAPDGAGAEWWEHEPLAHARRHLAAADVAFDTIIVDEAQDFAPDWIALLEELFDPAGPRRLLVLADVAQQIYRRGYEVPGPDDGWARAELSVNCRNTHLVAAAVAAVGGAAPAAASPEGEPVRHLVATDADEVLARLGEELDRLILTEGRSPADVLIVTSSSADRHRVRAGEAGGWTAVAWEEQDGHEMICETIHRSKGLENDAVVLVAAEGTSDELLYIGASRARSHLTVIGPACLGLRLGLGSASAG